MKSNEVSVGMNTTNGLYLDDFLMEKPSEYPQVTEMHPEEETGGFLIPAKWDDDQPLFHDSSLQHLPETSFDHSGQNSPRIYPVQKKYKNRQPYDTRVIQYSDIGPIKKPKVEVKKKEYF